jgi:hypothetical protein
LLLGFWFSSLFEIWHRCFRGLRVVAEMVGIKDRLGCLKPGGDWHTPSDGASRAAGTNCLALGPNAPQAEDPGRIRSLKV